MYSRYSTPSTDVVAWADGMVGLLRRVLPAEEADRLVALGMAADLSDLLAITREVSGALSGLPLEDADLKGLLECLEIVHQQFLKHAPFHLESLSGYLTDAIVRLEDSANLGE